MADQIFNVSCGFFDAINNDRTYSADDMNRPYKRLVSDGVFPAPRTHGASTDFQVTSAGGMVITVNKGEGIFGSKWFQNETVIPITIPENNDIHPRIDSVIIQVDNRSSGRTGNIIYRTGTPAFNPAAPDLNTAANLYEYRVANIYVLAGTTAVDSSDIVDLRGSDSCPWTTGTIKQVDTSVLWQQFQTAYQNQFNSYNQQFQTYTANQRQAWNDFLSTLTDELTVSTNLIMLTSHYDATGTTGVVPINIAAYDSTTDVLLVFIDGELAVGKYTLRQDSVSISLTDSIGIGDYVDFIVFHSVIAADIASTLSTIQALSDDLSDYFSDSGWIALTLENGAQAYDSGNTPAYRSIGGKVYLHGGFKNVTTANTVIATLPVALQPEVDFYFVTQSLSSGTVTNTITMVINTAGQLKLVGFAASGTTTASDLIPISAHYLSENVRTNISTIPDGDEVNY